ncbi:Fur family transcriptional regulator [Mycolicibacterium llatzerense]|uniref:Fur family transcriptional regulator n=1 Tax=Mycolicibacterium llatzerense TaxID=280871 RepID=UPI0021B5B957|nr:Fur family transcriptional regulator [Mycolicibacterium llatzerense]MCT7361569.1 transcriptional repressor [Mycolicibacterium llatzerense]
MVEQVPGQDSHRIERIGELLRAHGLRRTVPRIAVLVAIEPIHGHLSVSDIHQRLIETAAHDAQPPDLATVYRTVTTLVGHGVLHSLTVEGGTTTYGLAKDAHHHAVCTQCGAVIEIPAQRLTRALRSASAASAFTLSEEAGLTLHGLCPRCQEAQ